MGKEVPEIVLIGSIISTPRVYLIVLVASSVPTHTSATVGWTSCHCMLLQEGSPNGGSEHCILGITISDIDQFVLRQKIG